MKNMPIHTKIEIPRRELREWIKKKFKCESIDLELVQGSKVRSEKGTISTAGRSDRR